MRNETRTSNLPQYLNATHTLTNYLRQCFAWHTCAIERTLTRTHFHTLHITANIICIVHTSKAIKKNFGQNIKWVTKCVYMSHKYRLLTWFNFVINLRYLLFYLSTYVERTHILSFTPQLLRMYAEMHTLTHACTRLKLSISHFSIFSLNSSWIYLSVSGL